MKEFYLLATMILRYYLSICRFDQSKLSRLLSRHCCDAPTYQAIEQAVLRNLRNLFPDEIIVPCVQSNGHWVNVLPGKALFKLVSETRAEIFRLMRGVCEEIVSQTLRFEKRTLFIRGRKIMSWRKQDVKNRPQIDLLTAFQEANWAPIENPLDANKFDLSVVVRNLNRKVRGWLHFEVRDGKVSCERIR